MHPQHIKPGRAIASAQPAKDPTVQWTQHARTGTVPEQRKKFMMIPVQQRNIPLDPYAESFVLVVANRKIRSKEYSQVDIRLLSDPAQHRCLVLNRVTHQVSQPDFVLQSASHLQRS